MRSCALIVTYNRLIKLKKTLSETLAQGFSEVVIVNNASTDLTQQWLESLDDPRLHLIHLPENCGGAGGFYQGSHYISNHIDADWVFFYDDDAYPEAQMLAQFNALDLEQHEVICAQVRDRTGELCRMNLPFQRLPHSLGETLHYLCRPGRYLPAPEKRCDVQTVSFVGMAIRKQVLTEHLADIDPSLFIYFDDLYFGYRLFKKQRRITFIPSIKFTHDVTIQGNLITPEWKVYYLCRNLLLSRALFPEQRPFSNAALLLRLLKYLLLLPRQRNKSLYWGYWWRGVRQGLQGITGKLS